MNDGCLFEKQTFKSKYTHNFIGHLLFILRFYWCYAVSIFSASCTVCVYSVLWLYEEKVLLPVWMFRSIGPPKRKTNWTWPRFLLSYKNIINKMLSRSIPLNFLINILTIHVYTKFGWIASRRAHTPVFLHRSNPGKNHTQPIINGYQSSDNRLYDDQTFTFDKGSYTWRKRKKKVARNKPLFTPNQFWKPMQQTYH